MTPRVRTINYPPYLTGTLILKLLRIYNQRNIVVVVHRCGGERESMSYHEQVRVCVERLFQAIIRAADEESRIVDFSEIKSLLLFPNPAPEKIKVALCVYLALTDSADSGLLKLSLETQWHLIRPFLRQVDFINTLPRLSSHTTKVMRRILSSLKPETLACCHGETTSRVYEKLSACIPMA
jgi:hypothetical protein